jgi:hypothetical protein
MFTIEKKSPQGDMRHGWTFVYCDSRLSKVESRFEAAKARLPAKWRLRLTGPGVNLTYYRDDSAPPTIPAHAAPVGGNRPRYQPTLPPQGSIADAAAQDDDDLYDTFI